MPRQKSKRATSTYHQRPNALSSLDIYTMMSYQRFQALCAISLSRSRRKYLNLVSSVEVDNHDPDGISYVSSGYSPLSVRLVEAISSGWTGSSIARGGGEGTKEEVLKELQVGGGSWFINAVQIYHPEDLLHALKKRLEDVAQFRKIYEEACFGYILCWRSYIHGDCSCYLTK
jgi:hypothetical protein